MAMPLLDAPEYDPSRERRRTTLIVSIVALVLVVGALVWFNRYWPEKRVVNKFFAALQKQDFETAYGIYFADPDWRQHQQKYGNYPYSEFWKDWGPSGEWGVIKSYNVYGAHTCPGQGSGSGVVVDVIVNERRAKHAQVWVEKSDKTLSSPPCELLFQ
ncbi:MAG: hypothetical protein JST79_15490 [Acidobacteria bacterium]|nr:hypothetical protein [Acidobacteriota bacterium]